MRKRVYTTPEEKIQVMLDAGLEPLEPFTNKDAPWRSRCLGCDREVAPRYHSVHRGNGGCKYCASRASDLEDVAIVMKAAGLVPLEPFPGARKPWRVNCVVCNRESTPQFGNVKNGSTCRFCSKKKVAQERKFDDATVLEILAGAKLELIGSLDYGGQRESLRVTCLRCNRQTTTTIFQVRLRGSGCAYCAGKRVDPTEAAEFMRASELVPLEDYPGSNAPWRCECAVCRREVSPSYSALRAGQGGCAYCAGSRVDPEEAASFLIEEKKLRPLEPYPGAAQPWRVECLKCGYRGAPAYANLRQGHGGCLNCAGKYVDPDEAVKTMMEAGITPKGPYLGSNTKWPSTCDKCSRDIFPTYHGVSSGRGCRYCAEVGIRYGEPGYLYLMAHRGYRSLKIGISNTVPRKKHYNRIKQHEKSGWALVHLWDFDTAEEAFSVEQRFLDWIRVDLGLPRHLDPVEMPQGGSTETFSGDGAPVSTFVEKVREIIDGSGLLTS